jgi:type I restriction enzyme M protein
MVPLAEIEQNDFNLNIPRYIDSSEEEDIQDISAHLFGGIPNQDVDALEKYWGVFPSLKKTLFSKGDRKGYSIIKVEPEHIKKTIYEHSDFESYSKDIEKIFKKWANKHKPMMHELKKSSNIKVFINELSENILQAFSNAPLIDKYLAKESKMLEELEAEQESITQTLEEMEEEHGGEEGCLEELKGPKGISKGSVQERVMAIKQEILDSKFTSDKHKKLAKTIKKNFLTVNWQKGIEDEEDLFSELDILYEYLDKLEANAAAKRQLKQAQKDLESKADSQYKKLSKDEIKELVIENKWLTNLYLTVKAEKDRISQALSQRIKELAERYEKPLPEIRSEVDALSNKVKQHLEKMGF